MIEHVSKINHHIKRDIIKEKDTVLLIIDIQEKLVRAIPDESVIINNAKKIIDTFKLLKLVIFHTEQNPLKLGKTIKALGLENVSPLITKMTFSCCSDEILNNELKTRNIKNVIIAGVESHVCVLQTSLDLISMGYNIFVPIDAIGSRNMIDHKAALIRMQQSGCIISSTESLIFELCNTAERGEFKVISSIIKRS